MTGSGRQYDRRRVLYLAGVVGASALAGCTDDGGTEPGGDGDETGGDDGGDTDSGSDDSSGTDGGGDADGSDGGETDDTDGETTDDTDGDTTGDTDDGGDTDGDTTDDSGESPRLRDVFAFEQSYVMEFDTTDGTGVWTFHEGDSYFEGTFGGERTEIYRIRSGSEVETYTVAGGQCFKTSVDLSQDDIFDPEQPEADSEEYYASGTETVDGQEAYVFDVEGGTYYVSVDTGYPVRFESQEGDVVRFHSWGETEPISPPEGECTEV